jgi:hypothetical protein
MWTDVKSPRGVVPGRWYDAKVMIVRTLAWFPNWLLRIVGWVLNVIATISFIMVGIYLPFLFEPATTHNHAENVAEGVHVVIPQAGTVLLCAVIGRILIAKAKRRKFRLKHNLCAACGYDLRATPDTCPECGAKNSY